MIMPTAERGVCLFLPRIREFAIRMDGLEVLQKTFPAQQGRLLLLPFGLKRF
jgi:hypothetical protein